MLYLYLIIFNRILLFEWVSKFTHFLKLIFPYENHYLFLVLQFKILHEHICIRFPVRTFYTM